ncbi:hypothetical protein INT48_000716 [Thamnidium elegans]|uniref:GAR domain-containing protein n=1 Tax=Thamnidium elegans TaxID=101142 RepID=A0A8H7SYE4_9FUNG|nr:hypothetical protein INT48_000716 [Thamnidium elegans]
MSDVSIEDETWQPKALLCLAHHFFPDALPDLVVQLESSPHLTTSYNIFEQHLKVLPAAKSDWICYLKDIEAAIVENQQLPTEDTLRDLHIGSTNLPDQMLDKQLNQVMVSLNRLFQQLVDLSIREGLSSSTRSPSPHITNAVEEILMTELPIKNRPLEDIPCMTLDEISVALHTLESRDLSQLKQCIDSLPTCLKSHPNLAVRISAIDATHAALHLQLHKGNMMRTTIQFTSSAASIRNELEFIQAKMLKTTTTDVGIQDLETRSKAAGTAIDHLGYKFKELFGSDTVCLQEYNFLRDKFNLICSWVDDVRVWFVEAERIRAWIEQRIHLLEAKPNMNALEEVELDYEVLSIDQLNSEQQGLEGQVEAFDKEDMARLRAHVKALTGGNKDLSPADTTTIEITFTTLMTLDRLMHLLRRHSYELQMLTLRMYWEQEYDVSVTWVRNTGENVRLFVQQKARWRPPPLSEYDSEEKKRQEKNEIINSLIDFEKQISVFDQGQFTATVNMYQDLDDACNIELPSHLESRQVAIEEAFEELSNRISFARQVVEQYLVVTDFLDRADKLKYEGDNLRQDITVAAEQHGAQSSGNTDFGEKVSLFQENAVRLVTSVASRVPYPEASHPTDEQGNDDANEVIRMVIGARKSALVLFGEALDHSLASYRRALQLQKRAKQLQDEIVRLQSWVDERMRSIKKSKVDVFVGKCALDETDLARLNKERDGQVAKMKGIKENDIKKLSDNIQGLQTASAQPPTNLNTVALVGTLNEGMVGLEDQLVVLNDALQVHSLCLDILGKRISWETQHSKTTLWISNMTFSVWEFISRKAQWRTDMELDLDRQSIQLEFDLMQNKVQEFYNDQLKPVDQTFTELANGFLIILNSTNIDTNQAQDNITPEHVQRRQDTLDQSYHNLCDLIEFSKDVLQQHTALTDFSTQVSTLGDKGRQLISDIQEANDVVMKLIDVDARREQFVSNVKEFSQDVVQVWMQCGSQLPYPQCSEDARATRPSTNDDEISTEVATIIYKNYTELQDLVKRMTDLLQRLDVSIVYRLKLETWCKNSDEFDDDVKQLTQEIDTVYSFDLSTGVVESNTQQVHMQTYLDKSKSFEGHVMQLKTEKYQPLLHDLDELKCAVESDEQVKSVIDPAVTQATMIALESSWQELNDRVASFQNQANACHHRMNWESVWNDQWSQVNRIQDQVREWMNEKNLWISSAQGDLDDLISRIQVSDTSLNQLQEKVGPLKNAFDNMMASYKSCDMVYTTSLETKQDDLDKLFSKLLDLVATQVSEIQLLKQRHDWEAQVDQELKACNEKALEIESFIRNSARWAPSLDLDLKCHPSVDTQVNALSVLLENISNLQTKNPALLQSELIYKRKAGLEATMDRVQEHVNFVDQVLEQRNMIVHRLTKVSELESLAESIKAGFLASDEVYGQEQENLQEYNLRVSQLESSMSYPVRHYRDHDAQCREEDVAHNTVMTDMLNDRRSRLDELGSSLESILKSKERLSRCKAAEETYMSEANAVKEWMEAKYLQLSNLEPGSQDVHELRAAVNAIGALQSAATTYTSSVQALKESANQCVIMIQQQGDDEDILARIQATQLNINSSWKDLVQKIDSTKIRLSSLLRHREYVACVESFKQQCQSFTSAVTELDLADVTEDVSNQWQSDIEMLSSTFIEQIKSRLTEEKAKQEEDVSSDLVQEMSDRYTLVLEEFETFKALVAEKTVDANHDRLKKDYFSGADEVDACMAKTRDALDSACRHIIYGKSVQDDQATVDQVTESYQTICDVFEKHHETYDEQRSFYRFLQLNKVSGLSQVDVRQQDLEQRWKQLKQDVTNDKQHADSVSQWFDLHAKLNEMQSESLSCIFTRLEDMEMDEVMPGFLEQDASLLKLLESRLSACWDTAVGLIDGGNLVCFQTRYDELQDDLKRATGLLSEKKNDAQQHVDFVACQKQLQEVQDAVELVTKDVNQGLDTLVVEENSSKYLEQLFRSFSSSLSGTEAQQKKILGQATALQEVLSGLQSKYTGTDDHARSIQSSIDVSVNSLNKALETEQYTNDMLRRVLGHAKSAENISTWIENCHTATAQVLGDHLDESEASFELSSLEQKLGEFENVIDSFKELSKNLLLIQDDHQVVSKLVEVVKKNSEGIDAKWAVTQDEFKDVEATVQKTTRGAAIARKIKNIMGMVGETREYINGFKLFDSDDTCSVHTTDISVSSDIGDTQTSSSDIGDTQASDTQASSDDEKTAIELEVEEKSSSEEKKSEIVKENQPLLTMLRQFEVENIQRNLQTMESDIKPQIESEMKELSTMISEIQDIDSMFIRQHEEIQESVGSLFQLFSIKYTELDKAMDIGKYLTLADDIEILQSSLEEAVSKSAPHHATLIGSSFSRTDLHAKQIELEARFNYYEKKIVQNMTSAKQQASVVVDKQDTESQLVSTHLKEMEQKWALIKKQFKTRKIELSRTIDTSVDPHDHHARIRKSSLPTRKASSILRERADSSLTRQRLSPTASSSSNSSKGSVNRLNPNRSTGRYLAPPLQHQPSKSATHVKPKAARVTTPKPPLNSYVADPDNDLDIEIGRIVNETPYRVKVKMVPGEVGRYWFGNLNPKLAYCRVLKSKMVMVRVGGGWTELSQFLRDHALLEGDFIPRSRRNNRAKMIPEEDEPKSPTIQEGFIETRRDFGRHQQKQQQRSVSPQNRSSTTTNSSRSSNSNQPTGSPSHSASTNTAGYKDGDKFIAVDHNGNQLEVKMRKVVDVGRNMSSSTANTNDYTRRRMARRKEKSETISNPSVTTRVTPPPPTTTTKVNPVTTTKNTTKNTNVKTNSKNTTHNNSSS